MLFRSRSTLDLVDTDSLTLLTFGAHDEWNAAITSAMPWCVRQRVGVDAPACDVLREICGVGPDGALLVRPDQHIAWKSTHMSAEEIDALTMACTRVRGD